MIRRYPSGDIGRVAQGGDDGTGQNWHAHEVHVAMAFAKRSRTDHLTGYSRNSPTKAVLA